MVNQVLVNFLKNSLNRGYTEDSLRRALLAKKWPIQEIEEAFLAVKKESPSEGITKPETLIAQPIQEQETIPIEPTITEEEIKETFSKEPKSKFALNFPKINFPVKKTLILAISFIAIFLVLTFTVLVYFYMGGLKDYTVVDPTTGEVLLKRCISEDCSDMKNFAMDFAKSHIKLSVIIGAIASALILVGYSLVRQKKIYVWIVNLAYFLLLIIIFYMWLTFTRA